MGLLSWLFAKRYAKNMMNTPYFSAKVDAVNEKLAKQRQETDLSYAAADAEFKKSEPHRHCIQCIAECNGNEDAGWDLFLARNQMVGDFNVTWEVACQGIRNRTDAVAMQLRNLKKETR